MCATCYRGIVDAAGTSAPFLVAGVGFAANKVRSLRTPLDTTDSEKTKAHAD